MTNPNFKDLLDQSNQWPDYYEFKFIVKIDDKHLVLEKLIGCVIRENPSGKGNYVSISARKLIRSTDEIIAVYELIGTVKGVISL